MARLFVVGEETMHVAGNPACPACLEDYPAACSCGGLMHAGEGEEGPDPDSGEAPVTQCDRCGLSEEELP